MKTWEKLNGEVSEKGKDFYNALGDNSINIGGRFGEYSFKASFNPYELNVKLMTAEKESLMLSIEDCRILKVLLDDLFNEVEE